MSHPNSATHSIPLILLTDQQLFHKQNGRRSGHTTVINNSETLKTLTNSPEESANFITSTERNSTLDYKKDSK